MHMELGRPTLIPHLLYLKNYVLFKFQFGNIAAPQVQKQILVHLPQWSTYPIFPYMISRHNIQTHLISLHFNSKKIINI